MYFYYLVQAPCFLGWWHWGGALRFPWFPCLYVYIYMCVYIAHLFYIYIYCFFNRFFRLGVGEGMEEHFFGYRCCTILDYATFGFVYVVMVPNVVLDGTESFEQPMGLSMFGALFCSTYVFFLCIHHVEHNILLVYIIHISYLCFSYIHQSFTCNIFLMLVHVYSMWFLTLAGSPENGAL